MQENSFAAASPLRDIPTKIKTIARSARSAKPSSVRIASVTSSVTAVAVDPIALHFLIINFYNAK